MQLLVASIVEGHGEVESVPVLLRRMREAALPAEQLRVIPPLRMPRSKLVKDGELERAVELAARKVSGRGWVLILIDADDDCPATLGPALLRRACAQRGDTPIALVVAKREYEAWFLAAAESLRGERDLPDDLDSPENPEEIRGAKEWLEKRMLKGRSYSAVLDQPALTAMVDLDLARRADSFDKCHREILRLLEDVRRRETNFQRGRESPGQS